MYQQFSGKTDLVEQYLRRIDDTGGIPMEQALFTPGATPRNRLLAIFDSPPADRFRGCSFHDAAVEAADEMPSVHYIVHEHKLQFIARLTDAAAQVGARDPYQLGHQLAVLFEGALALATSLNDTAALIHAGPQQKSPLIPQSRRHLSGAGIPVRPQEAKPHLGDRRKARAPDPTFGALRGDQDAVRERALVRAQQALETAKMGGPESFR